MSIAAQLLSDNPSSLERFRAVMDICSDAMFLIDRSGMLFLDANPAACRLLGYSHDELLAMGPALLSKGADHSHEKIYDRLIDGSVASESTQATVLRKDGVMMTLEVHRCAQMTNIGWVIVAVVRNLADRQSAQEQIAAADADLARLSIELQAAREEERKNLAARLHGDIGQLLAALRINLNLLQQQQLPNMTDCAQVLESMDKLVLSSIQSLRRISSELRPRGLAEGDLYLALETLRRDAGERYGFHCALRAEPDDLLFDEERSAMIFRIVEDALTNILPHADPKNVTLTFTRTQDSLQVCIRSDGAGIEQQADLPSYRLAGMRERVRRMHGSLRLAAEAGGDSRIDIALPLAEN